MAIREETHEGQKHSVSKKSWKTAKQKPIFNLYLLNNLRNLGWGRK